MLRTAALCLIEFFKGKFSRNLFFTHDSNWTHVVYLQTSAGLSIWIKASQLFFVYSLQIHLQNEEKCCLLGFSPLTMNNINQLKADQRGKHPEFDSYLEYIIRALFTGLATFSLGYAGLHLSQKIFARYLPYNTKTVGILVSSMVSVAGTYKVTADRTLNCLITWVD